MNVKKMAATDAARWAYAEMFFGEGAGTRRKLLSAEILSKEMKIPGYREAMDAAYAKQDMAAHAIKAAKERKALDRKASMGKNMRALKNGNFRSLSTGVFVVGVGGYYAHQLGYDKLALEEGKKLYKKAKKEIKYRKARLQGRNVEKIA